MSETTPTDPTKLDPAEAAARIQQAGVADESAAAVNANERPDEPEAEAHPS
jgi:hypothetical protein